MVSILVLVEAHNRRTDRLVGHSLLAEMGADRSFARLVGLGSFHIILPAGTDLDFDLVD